MQDLSKMDRDTGNTTFGSRPRTQAKWVQTQDPRAQVLTSNPTELDPNTELNGNWFNVWSTRENYNKNNNIYNTNNYIKKPMNIYNTNYNIFDINTQNYNNNNDNDNTNNNFFYMNTLNYKKNNNIYNTNNYINKPKNLGS